MMMNGIQFGKAFLLQDDWTGSPLLKRSLAQQARDNFAAKHPKTKVILHENKHGEGLYYRGSEFFLLTDETADQFMALRQQESIVQRKKAAVPVTREFLKEQKATLAKLYQQLEESIAGIKATQYSTGALEVLKRNAEKAGEALDQTSAEVLREMDKAETHRQQDIAASQARYNQQIATLETQIAEAEQTLPPEPASIFSLKGIQQRFQQFQDGRILPRQIQTLLSGATPLAVRSELNVREPLLTATDGVGITRKSLFFGHESAVPMQRS